jgi:DNA-binding MarR family transcriptional regulator
MALRSRLHRHPREVLEFVAALERAGRAVRMARRGVSARAGLTIAEWRMLRAVQASCGKPSVFLVVMGSARAAPSISSLAQRLGTTRQTAHRTVATLCAAKLVQIEIRGGDRRRRAVWLTSLGERSLATRE